MANLSIRSRRDTAGHAVHPVARVLVTLPDTDPDWDWGPTRVRVTLRSDGAILQSVARGDHGQGGWTGHSVITKSATGFPCCGAQAEMADRLAMFATGRWRGATVATEQLDISAGLR